jgi:hypothetical protein
MIMAEPQDDQADEEIIEELVKGYSGDGLFREQNSPHPK